MRIQFCPCHLGVMVPKAFLIFTLLILGCSEDEEITRGQLRIEFEHHINNEPVRFRSLEYQNSSGNKYEITNVQWFISRIRLYKTDGTFIEISEPLYHYIDSDLDRTLTCLNEHFVEEGSYKALSFVFGLEGGNNIPGQFPDAPESNMTWPSRLGGDQGGYHYMKLNGFWLDETEERCPFNLHLGVGQIYDDKGNIVKYVQNWFEVRTFADFDIQKSEITNVKIVMNIDSWFDTPRPYDLNVIGGMIMNRQDAMRTLCENGIDVFEVEKEQLPD